MTPCEELGYKVGDRFRAVDAYCFDEGSIVELFHDDGTDDPLWKLVEGGCRYLNANGRGAFDDIKKFVKISHTKTQLRHGDYVSTNGMTEDQYHAVAKAFMDAGADSGDEYGNFRYNDWNLFGWSEENESLDHQDDPWKFSGRHLTIEQVLGEDVEQPTIQSLLKKADKHARKAQNHEAKRKEAIDQARAMLPDGWELTPSIDHDVRIGYTPLSEVAYREFNIGVSTKTGKT